MFWRKRRLWPELITRPEDVEWFLIDPEHGQVRLPDVIDAEWLSNPRIFVRRIERKAAA